MGFLHKLWDETLAGPAPDNGLGKLRKYDSFSGRSLVADDSMIITRSITILKRSSSSNYRSLSGDSVPASSTVPGTPLSPGTPTTSPRGDFKKLTRRKKSVTDHQRAEPRSPTVYDWIVISALDR
jgi:hypothetical protein